DTNRATLDPQFKVIHYLTSPDALDLQRLPGRMPAEGEGLRVGGVVSGDGDEARIEHEAVLEPSDVVDQDVVPAPGPKRRPRELRDEEPEVYREDRDHEDEHPDQRHEGAHAFLI